jgi:hypothetical protein
MLNLKRCSLQSDRLFAGQYSGPDPNKSLCFFQAAVTDSCPPTFEIFSIYYITHLTKDTFRWSVAILVLVWHMRSPGGPTQAISVSHARKAKLAMIGAPYIAFLGFFLAGCIVSCNTPLKHLL